MESGKFESAEDELAYAKDEWSTLYAMMYYHLAKEFAALGEEGEAKTLSFVYDGRDSSVGVTWTTNVVSVVRDEEGTFVASMVSRGAREACTTTGTFVRKIIIQWSVRES